MANTSAEISSDEDVEEDGCGAAGVDADFFAPACLAGFETARAVAICDGIIDLIAVFFNVSGRQIRSTKRTSKPVSRVRQIGMYVAHVGLGMKMADVGAGFGRVKSTVIHACHTIEDMRDDEDFDLIVSRVERLVAIAFSLEPGEGRRDG